MLLMIWVNCPFNCDAVQVRTHLHRVESAVSVEGEADDVGGVLVPAGVDGVAHDVSGLGEDLLDQHLLAAQRDPLAQVGRDADHQTLAGRRPLGLSLRLPAVQLPHHRGQLVVPRLLVQLGEVLVDTRGGGSCLETGGGLRNVGLRASLRTLTSTYIHSLESHGNHVAFFYAFRTFEERNKKGSEEGKK